MHIIAFIVFGLVIGLIARAILPGQQKLSLIWTTVLGMAGSLLGGLVGNLLTGSRAGDSMASGWIGSIIGALVLLGIATMVRRSSHGTRASHT